MMTHSKPPTPPSSKLPAYQREGQAFLVSKSRALLADEMGLGKTVEVLVAINFLLQQHQISRTLIVAPASLKSNWEREARKWACNIAIQQVQGDADDRRAWYALPVPILIASYEQIRNDFYLYPPAQQFDLVVLDEAQRVKSPVAATTVAVGRIITDRVWALTGTPLENRSADLETIVRLLRPTRVPKDASLPELHEAMQGIFLRRRKEDVLPELPKIVDAELVVDLSPQQRVAYDALWEQRATTYLDTGGMLGLITRLKQICNWDPATDQSAKLDALGEVLEEVVGSGGKLLIFSQYVETLKWLSPRLPLENRLLYGSLSATARDDQLKWFRELRTPCALLVSLRAGGVGLNIPEATHIALFDRWWNPALEDQAINRAHRFGRTIPLTVVRLITAYTIEERIANMLTEKRLVFQRYIESAPISRITPQADDLRRLLDLPLEKKRRLEVSPIAETREIKDIPLEQLEIGLGQVRTKNVSKDIEELAESIRRVGLLEPIVVCDAETPGKYQILTGQRRYQAVKSLGHPAIKALVVDRKVSETEAKIISLTENAVRLDLTRPEMIDAVSALYYHYNQSVTAVAEATGLSLNRIRELIKYDRLVPQLKELVKSGELQLDAAVKAQDAASLGQGQPDVGEAIKLAKAMNPMTKYQREKIRKDRVNNPETSVEEVIEEATSGGFVTQIIIGMSGNTLAALQEYAQAEGVTQSDAATSLIEAGLSGAGYLG